MRYSTERPEVYDVSSSIKFDPTSNYKYDEVHSNVIELINSKWHHPFGDGTASKIIVEDIIKLSKENNFNRHNKDDYDFDISRSFLK